MFKRILPFIILFVALLLDTSVLPVISRHWAMPMLLYTSVIVLGLLLGRTRGLLYGMLSGLLVDVLVGYPLGLMAVLYLLAGYAAGFAGRKFQRYLLTTLATPAFCLACFEAVMAVYEAMAGGTLTLISLRNALCRIAIQTVLALLLYLLYDKMLSPSWSKYASR